MSMNIEELKRLAEAATPGPWYDRAGVLRAIGGWMSDKYGAYKTTWWVMWVLWVCFFILSYPQTALVIQTVKGPVSLNIEIGRASCRERVYVLV